MLKHYDAIVIGAGAIGGSVGYYLSRLGLSVALLDQNAIGSGASAHATGFLSNNYDYNSEPNINDMLFDSSALFDKEIPNIVEISGVDPLVVVRPGLRLALNESEIELLQQRSEFSRFRNRYPFQLLTGKEVRKLDHRLSDNILAGGYIPEETQIDSYKFTLAVSVAAERLGAEIFQRQVLGLIKENGYIRGVRCESGNIYADNVIICSGIGTDVILRDLGVDIDITPLKGQAIRMKYNGDPLGFHFGGVHAWHLINRGDDLISAGSTSEVNNHSEPPNQQATSEILDWVMSVMPCLEDAQIVETMYGFRPMSPDGLPIVGSLSDVQNLYFAIGHGHKGIHLSLITGKIIADWITSGCTSYNTAFMSPARFMS